MTRKHFEMLARVLRDAKKIEGDNEGAKNMRRYIAKDLADELRMYNGRFDTERFLRAADVN